MKAYLLLLLLAGTTFLSAQKVNDLIHAEKSFAAYSKEHTTKAAFLHYLDSNSIVFGKGEPYNGLVTWSERTEDSSLLLWGPQVAVLSASGDFGFTAGPSEYRNNRSPGVKGSPGYFSSVWHRNRTGTWKALLDIGISHTTAYVPPKNIQAITLPAGTAQKVKDTAGAGMREAQFITALSGDRNNLQQQFFWNTTWLLINNYYPVTVQKVTPYDFKGLPKDLTLSIAGHLISSAGDMYVSYGKAGYNQKEGNYLLIWVKQTGTWQLALLTLN